MSCTYILKGKGILNEFQEMVFQDYKGTVLMQFITRHSIDIYNDQFIAGWFFNCFKKKRPINLSFVSGDAVIGRIVAENYRRDLQAKKIHPTGCCGFDFEFPAGVDIAANTTLNIHLDAHKKPFLKLPTNNLKSQIKKRPLPPIFFMHIPKTAGTSFNLFMRMHVSSASYRSHIETCSGQDYATLARENSYLAGHLPIVKLKKHFCLKDFDCYSLIREPYSHLHSHLNWLKGIANPKNRGFFLQHNSAVQKLAMKVDRINFSSFSQVKDFIFNLEGCELDFFDNCQTRYFLDYRPEKISTKNFQETLHNIDLFKYIGLTEKYEQFRKFISSSYRLPEVSIPSTANKAIQPRLYDYNLPELKEILYPLVSADMLLYDYINGKLTAS